MKPRAGSVPSPGERRRFGAGLACCAPAALAIVAILAQIAIPALHALHDAASEQQATALAYAAGHRHDHPTDSHARHAGDLPDSPRQERHDESTCPTCLSLLALRTFTSLSATVTPVQAGATEPADAHVEAAPLPSRDRSPVAAPRGPPVSC